MKLRIVTVDLQLTPTQKRVGIFLAALAIGGVGASVAMATVPHQFTAGQTLKAAELNENFKSLDDGVDALDARVTTLEAEPPPPLSGFKALRTAAQSIPNSVPIHLNFDTEEFDYADEYNPATGKFTVKVAGVYAIQCASHVTAPGSGGILSSFIVKNGAELFDTDEANGGTYQTEVASTVASLAVGDAIECQFFHTTGTNVALTAGPRAHFSAVRVGPAP